MKKILMLIVSIFFLAGFCSPVFAQLRKDVDNCKGKIININLLNYEITVKEYGSNSIKSFWVEPALINTLKKDTEVVVFFKKGSNVARTVIVTRKSPSPTKTQGVLTSSSNTTSAATSAATSSTSSATSSSKTLSTMPTSTKTQK